MIFRHYKRFVLNAKNKLCIPNRILILFDCLAWQLHKSYRLNLWRRAITGDIKDNMMKNQRGFTLIELAIVLVIIGLLLGGVLKGQELINSAKVKNMASDFKNVQVYIYGYQDRYRALPGDDRAADTHTGGQNGAGGTLGNGVIEGNWDSAAVPAASEAEVFWQHVRLAGFAPGPTNLNDANYYPRNADGGIIGVESVSQFGGPAGLTGAFVICSAGILGTFAEQLDITMDDGNTATGSVRSYDGANWAINTGPAAGQTLVDANAYNVCMSF
jgi:prepilin-type N-terminal cleavage/methylation domain-containing protein